MKTSSAFARLGNWGKKMDTPVINDLALDLGEFALDNEWEDGRNIRRLLRDGRRRGLIPASTMSSCSESAAGSNIG
jgi:hypothetical protein